MKVAHAFRACRGAGYGDSSTDWVGLVVHQHQQAFHVTDKEAEDFAEVLVAARDELKKNSPRP